MSQILNAQPSLVQSVQQELGDIPWASPEQANANDGNSAQCSFTLAVVDQRSDNLRATGYDFSQMAESDLPVAIGVTIDRRLAGADVQDLSVQLVLDGAPIGENKAVLGQWPSVDTEQGYGDVDDDWGVTLTPDIVLDPDFGVQLRVQSSGGGGPVAAVDAILMSLYFLPATTGQSLGSRVQQMVRSINPSREGPSTLEVDAAISEAYMHVGAIMPQAVGEVIGALTIPGGSATFQLPVAADGRDSVVQYGGEVSIRRRHDGRFMFRVSNEEMDRKTDGFGSLRMGPTATYFSLYEDAAGVVQGRCFPRPKAAVVCDVFSSTVLDDPRDAEDFDSVVQAMTPTGQAAVVYRAAGMLAAASSPGRRASLRISSEARRWIAIGDKLAYRAAVRAHDLASVGRVLREQYQAGPTRPSAVGGTVTAERFPATRHGVMLGNILMVVDE